MPAITPRRKPKPENLASLICLVRGEKVLLSQHLAELYGVSVSALNQAVRRNIERFPDDFMFQLSDQEFRSLKSQIVNSNRGARLRSQTVILKRGEHLKYLPYAFTEQGVSMLSSVLRSPRAVEVNIAIMRTFVQSGASWIPTAILQEGSRRWRAATTSSSPRCSTPSSG